MCFEFDENMLQLSSRPIFHIRISITLLNLAILIRRPIHLMMMRCCAIHLIPIGLVHVVGVWFDLIAQRRRRLLRHFRQLIAGKFVIIIGHFRVIHAVLEMHGAAVVLRHQRRMLECGWIRVVLSLRHQTIIVAGHLVDIAGRRIWWDIVWILLQW